MSLVLHICTGLGLALAAGIRPFTPALAAGALARADAGLSVRATHYAFLQSGWFLLAAALAMGVFFAIRAPVAREVVATIGVALGGVLFAAVLAAHHDAVWPGLIAGVLAAGLALSVSRPVFAGASARLEGAAAAAVALYADAVGLVLAIASWFAGPVALVALVFFAALAWRRRERTLARLGGGLRVLR